MLCSEWSWWVPNKIRVVRSRFCKLPVLWKRFLLVHGRIIPPSLHILARTGQSLSRFVLDICTSSVILSSLKSVLYARHFESYKQGKTKRNRAQRSKQCSKVHSTKLDRTVQKVCTVHFQVYSSLQCTAFPATHRS